MSTHDLFEVFASDSDTFPILTTSSEEHAEVTDRAMSVLDILSETSDSRGRRNASKRRAGSREYYEAETQSIETMIAAQMSRVSDTLKLRGGASAAPTTYTDAMAILVPRGGDPIYSDRKESAAAQATLAEAYNTLEDLYVVLGARRIAQSLTRERLQGQVGDPYTTFFANPSITECLIGSGLFTELNYIDNAESVTFDSLTDADQDTILAGLRLFSCFFDITTDPPTSQTTLPVFRAFALLPSTGRAAVLALFKDAQFSKFANTMQPMGGHDGIPTMYAIYAIFALSAKTLKTPEGKRASFKDIVSGASSKAQRGATLPALLDQAFGLSVSGACQLFQAYATSFTYLDTACRIMSTYESAEHSAIVQKLFKKRQLLEGTPNGMLTDLLLITFGVGFCIGCMKDSQDSLTQQRLVTTETKYETKIIDGIKRSVQRPVKQEKRSNTEAGYALTLIENKVSVPKKISVDTIYNSYIRGRNDAEIHYFEWCLLLYTAYINSDVPPTWTPEFVTKLKSDSAKCAIPRNLSEICDALDSIRANPNSQLRPLAEAMAKLVYTTASDKYDADKTVAMKFVLKSSYDGKDADINLLASYNLVTISGKQLTALPQNPLHLAALLTVLVKDVMDFSSYAYIPLHNEDTSADPDAMRFEYWRSVKHNPLSLLAGLKEISGCCVRPGNWGVSCAISALFTGDDYNVVTFAHNAPSKTGTRPVSDFAGMFTHYGLKWETADLAGAVRAGLKAADLDQFKRDGASISEGASELEFRIVRSDLRTDLGDAVLTGRSLAPSAEGDVVFDNREVQAANNVNLDSELRQITYIDWFQTEHMKQIGIVPQERRMSAEFDAVKGRALLEMSKSLKFKQLTKTYTDNNEFRYVVRAAFGEMLVLDPDALFARMTVVVNSDLSASVQYDELPALQVSKDYLMYMFSWPKGPRFMLKRGEIHFECADDCQLFVLDTLMFPSWFRTPLVRDGVTTTYDDMVRMRMPEGGLFLNGNGITI